MKEISVYYEILKHIFMKFIHLFQSWAGGVALFATVTLASFTTLQVLFIIFFAAVTFDFITGVLASYMEVKRGEVEVPKSGYIFESKRARSSGVKLVGYLSLILCVYIVNNIFFNKTFDFEYIKTKNLTLTEITIAICAAIEIYSAFVENLKRAGFDILGKISKIADSIWSVFRKVKGEGNE